MPASVQLDANLFLTRNPDENDLVATSMSTGKTVWSKNELGSATTGHTWSSILADGPTVYAVLTSADEKSEVISYELYSIAAATGQVRWKTAGLSGPLAAGDGEVFAEAVLGASVIDDDIAAVSAATGKELWSYKLAVVAFLTDVAVDGNVVLATSGGSAYGIDLYAFSASRGTVLWSYAYTKGDMSIGGTNLVIDGSTVVFISGITHLAAFNVASGRRLWVTKITGIVADSLIGAAGVLYDGSCAYQLSTGKVLWKFKEGDLAAALVADGRLLAGGAGSVGTNPGVWIAYGAA
jgi:outer membrane protein assembly factor BamB